MNPRNEIEPGLALPLGAYLREGGAQFSIFSRHASKVCLFLYDRLLDETPTRVIHLDPRLHRTGDIWHVWIGGVKAGQVYAYRADGPYRPREGHRFNKYRLLLDPYARAVAGNGPWDFGRARGYEAESPLRDLSLSMTDNSKWTGKCILAHDRFDWQGDRPLKRPDSELIIYETHVRGFTVHPSSGVNAPGTFLGVIEKIPYLNELGITAVEFLPVQEFNENELEVKNPFTGGTLRNYWGYSTVAFFAPKRSYSSRKDFGIQVSEFKEMVRELHKAGIEVILDVVFNHTAEGNELGPTLSFRGLDNVIYYLLEEDKRFYKNYSGCGNTLNCNHPVVRSFIADCLRYWVTEMHVDGFRFDLASVLGRDRNGEIVQNPPVLERIAEDPILRDTKLIAEAWDAGGAYQLGSFPGERWWEWNGRYRDDIRRFWRGDPGMVGVLATRICGSADLYQKSGKEPLHSINFVTCHDGFTLNDLVSYSRRYNEANGEENRDGFPENFSCNYGVEGPATDPRIERVRNRQIKNMLATLLVSRGVPLILGGDEFRRSQKGNNNAYCQDNELSWYQWDLLEKNREIFRFVQEMIAFRKRHPVLRRGKFYTDRDIAWFGPDGGRSRWDEISKSLGCMIFADDPDDADLYLMFHADSLDRTFVIPPALGTRLWHLAMDTGKPSPRDILGGGKERRLLSQRSYRLTRHSMVILVSK